MTNDGPKRDPRTDDDALGDVIRDAVDDWRMPPDRLHAKTWRERIGRGSGGSGSDLGAGATAWLRRLATAAAAALIGAVVLALVAVWLGASRPPSIGVVATNPPSASAGHSQTPVPTSAPVSFPPGSPGPSPLPQFELHGTRLTGSVIANAGGSFMPIDLASGTVGADLIPGATFESQLFHRPGGGLICACLAFSTTDSIAGTLTIEVRMIAAGSGTVRRIPVATLTADADPNAGQNDSAGVAATADLSTDGRTMYFAWAYRTSPTWHVGIDVVDLATGTLVQTVRLLDRPSIVSGSPVAVSFQALRVAPDRSAVMTSIFGLDGTASVTHVLATMTAGKITGTTILPAATGTLDGNACSGWNSEGWATAHSYFSVCSSPPAIIVFDHAGRVLASQSFAGTGQQVEPSFSEADVVDRIGGLLYHWDPFGRTLTRVDLATGLITGTASAAQADSGSGGALGSLGELGRAMARWIAPTATAKTFLMPGLALSPDGSRIYAIGVSSSGATSSGIDVFDTRAMRQVDHWAPIADLVSIAVSPDGRLVYVAGAPAGDSSIGTAIPASLAVFDAATGTLHLVAGDLGSDYLALLP
jgi:hypothetical protein